MCLFPDCDRRRVVRERACDKQTLAVSVVTLDLSEIMNGYNTEDTVLSDRRTKQVMK